MDRIERIGPREPTWLEPAIDPNPEDIARRRRREEERRRERQREAARKRARDGDGDEPPHHIDVIA